MSGGAYGSLWNTTKSRKIVTVIPERDKAHASAAVALALRSGRQALSWVRRSGTRPADARREVRELLDKQAIRDVLARYCRGIDRCDGPLVASCYVEHSYDDHGPFQGTGWELATRPDRYSRKNKASHHALCQTLIELDGDVATAESYIVYRRVYTDDIAVDRLVEGNARYLDRFIRCPDGQWRIQTRRTVMDLSSEGPVPPEGATMKYFTQAKRWPDDLVYRFSDPRCFDPVLLRTPADPTAEVPLNLTEGGTAE